VDHLATAGGERTDLVPALSVRRRARWSGCRPIHRVRPTSAGIVDVKNIEVFAIVAGAIAVICIVLLSIYIMGR
jgi:hypothetical protein